MLGADDQTPLWFEAFVTLAVWSGMRPSEVRGLPWRCVDFERGLIKVRQRADFAGTIGAPKSKAGRRDIPMTPSLKRALQEFYLASGRPAPDRLVFATRTGQPMSHSNIVQRFTNLYSAARHCGTQGRHRQASARPHRQAAAAVRAPFLRHAAASLFIDQRWSAKQIQTVMGHSSIQMVLTRGRIVFAAATALIRRHMARLEAQLARLSATGVQRICNTGAGGSQNTATFGSPNHGIIIHGSGIRVPPPLPFGQTGPLSQEA